MKYISQEKDITIPKEVTVAVKARVVSVSGPRGDLKNDFRHVAVEIIFVTPQKVFLIRNARVSDFILYSCVLKYGMVLASMSLVLELLLPILKI
jgi:ribosomal protein L6P/L9E